MKKTLKFFSLAAVVLMGTLSAFAADKNIQVSTRDTLVVQTRESNKKEFFDCKYVND